MMRTINLLLMLTYAAIGEDLPMGLIFTKLTNVHVVYDEVKLVYHSKLDEIYNLRENILEAKKKLEKECEQDNTEICKLTGKQAENQIEIVLDELDKLDAQNSRKKRFILCEWCGDARAFVEGTISARQGREYATEINKLQNETTIIHGIMQNQTMIIETSLKLAEKSFTNADMELKRIDSLLIESQKTTYDEINEINRKLALTNILQLITVMVNELNQLIQRAKETLNETKMGKVPELISLKRLKFDLANIQNELQPNQALPIDFYHENTNKIFKYARTGAIKIAKMIIIEIKIPIATREKFQLYKVTSIPIKLREKTFYIEPTMKYVLLNENQLELIQITEKHLEKSVQITENEILIKPTTMIKKRPGILEDNIIKTKKGKSIIREEEEKICEWEVLLYPTIENIMNNCKITQIPNGNYFIEVIENNIYYASISKGEIVSKTCTGRSIAIKLIGDTLIEIKKNCTLEGKNFIIHARNKYSIEGKQAEIIRYPNELISEEEYKKLMNVITLNTTIKKTKVIKSSETFKTLIAETIELEKKMNHTLNFKKLEIEPESNWWPEMSDFIKGLNPINWFKGSGLVIILVLILAILIVIKCVKCQKCGKRSEKGVTINLTELSRKHKATPRMKRRQNMNEDQENEEEAKIKAKNPEEANDGKRRN